MNEMIFPIYDDLISFASTLKEENLWKCSRRNGSQKVHYTISERVLLLFIKSSFFSYLRITLKTRTLTNDFTHFEIILWRAFSNCYSFFAINPYNIFAIYQPETTMTAFNAVVARQPRRRRTRLPWEFWEGSGRSWKVVNQVFMIMTMVNL